MKRIFSLILAVLLGLSCVTIALCKETVPTVSVNDATVTAGERVSVQVKLSGNPGIISLLLNVGYDASVLTLENVTDGGLFGEECACFGNDRTSNPYVILWEDGTAAQNITADGTLATLTFLVSPNAEPGKTEITIDADTESTLNVDLQSVEITTQNGFVNVQDPTDSLTGGSCGENVTWKLDENTGVLTVSGTGDMADYTASALAPWYDQRDKVKTVTIDNGVTRIGNDAFYYCRNLTGIAIPDGVTHIGNYAFYHCERLTSITIPNGVTSIGSYAFSACKKLTSITIPKRVTSIGLGAFSGTTSVASFTVDGNNARYSSDANGVLYNKDKTKLIQFPAGNTRTAFIIPNSVTRIGYSAFYYCTKLTCITIPAGVTSIGDGAFKLCTNLTSIAIPDSVTSIGIGAFEQCKTLTSVTIPNRVTSISNWAFAYCSNLTNITIPAGVTSIGTSAFSGCTSLATVCYGGTQQSDLTFEKNNEPLTDADWYYTEWDKTTVCVTEIAIKTAPAKTVYTVGDPLDTTGLTLTAVKNDGTNETVTTGFTCTPTTLTKAGGQTITVTYNGCTAAFNVTVEAPKVSEETTPTMRLSQHTAKVGDRVEMTLSIADNPGIVATAVNLTYDPNVLRLVSVQDGGLLGTGSFTAGKDLSAVPYTALWVNALASENYTGNGCMM